MIFHDVAVPSYPQVNREMQWFEQYFTNLRLYSYTINPTKYKEINERITSKLTHNKINKNNEK